MIRMSPSELNNNINHKKNKTPLLRSMSVDPDRMDDNGNIKACVYAVAVAVTLQGCGKQFTQGQAVSKFIW